MGGGTADHVTVGVPTGEGEDGGEDDVDPCAVDVEQDAEVNGDAAQHRETVDEGPVRGFQGDLTKTSKRKHSSFLFLTVLTSSFKEEYKQDVTDLQVDGEDQWGGGDGGEGLVVRGRLPVLAHGLQEGPVRDEEDDERDEDAVEQADEEALVVEHRARPGRGGRASGTSGWVCR